MLRLPPKPDPYNGFKDDQERRRALNARVRSYAAAVMVVAITRAQIDWNEVVRWLMYFLR
jgi:hypothetical protein